MLRIIVCLSFCLVSWACDKNDPGIETFDHLKPEDSDRTRLGVTVLRSQKKDFVYFSQTVFTHFPTDFWLYDSTSAQWSPRADFPGNDRLLPIILFFDDQIYMGLSKAQPQTTLNDWFVYNVAADSWTAKANCPYMVPAAMDGTRSGPNIIVGCAYSLDVQLCHFIYSVSANSWDKSFLTCDSAKTSCY